MAVDYNTAAGRVRLLLADVDESRQVLTDEHVGGYLALHGVEAASTDAPSWAVKRAAADALSAIATSETLVGKVIRSQDLTTDGPKVAAELRAQAAALRLQADLEEDAAADDSAGVFGVVEFHPWGH